jgi:hypothetical protein
MPKTCASSRLMFLFVLRDSFTAQLTALSPFQLSRSLSDAIQCAIQQETSVIVAVLRVGRRGNWELHIICTVHCACSHLHTPTYVHIKNYKLYINMNPSACLSHKSLSWGRREYKRTRCITRELLKIYNGVGNVYIILKIYVSRWHFNIFLFRPDFKCQQHIQELTIWIENFGVLYRVFHNFLSDYKHL